MSLETIRDKIREEHQRATSDNFKTVLNFMEQIVDEVIKSGGSGPDDGELSACQQQNAKLQAQLDALNRSTNTTAGILNSLRDILRIPSEQPTTQLVPLATSMMHQLDSVKNDLAKARAELEAVKAKRI